MTTELSLKPRQLVALLAATIPAKLPVLITGAPGIGKSDISQQAAAICDADHMIDHPAISDPTDYKGYPMPPSGGAQPEFVPFGNLNRWINATRLTVVVLEEIGQAPASVQAALMHPIQAREVAGHKISPHVCFVGCTNRRQDRAGVNGMIEPLKSRFATIVNLEPDLDDWVSWALAHNVPTELIAFVRFRPKFLWDFKPSADLVNTPSPRTIANIGRLMQIGMPAELEHIVYAGAAGESLAGEFMGFLQIFRTLPNPDLILMNPGAADVPTDTGTLYALCGALARKASDQTIDRLVTYFQRMPREFGVLAMRDALVHAPAIVNTRGYIQWAAANADVLL